MYGFKVYRVPNVNTNKLDGLLCLYSELEDKIRDILAELPNAGCGCDCGDDVDSIRLIHDGSFEDEIHRVCTHCGGII
jgi:hypothetical protein